MTNEMSKRKYPQEMLLMNDCPNCGQKVNSQFVENTIDEIVDLAVAEERKRIVEMVINYNQEYNIDGLTEEELRTELLSLIEQK